MTYIVQYHKSVLYMYRKFIIVHLGKQMFQ